MTKSRTDKYIIPFCVSGVGFLCVASPLFLNLGFQMPAYLASEQMVSKQNQERKEIKERKKLSETIKQTGIPMAGSTLTVGDYLDDEAKQPNIPKVVLNRYLNNQAWVFDASDTCIGRIVKGKFISKYVSATTCKDIPNGNR